MTQTAETYNSAPGSGYSAHERRTGMLLVFLSALAWSFGGTIARFIETQDSWTVVFWRSFWASICVLGFMVARDGLAGAWRAFRDMGWPGYVVSFCFAAASSCFVIALSYTKVANILLIQAGVPLLAALLGWAFFKEKVSLATWAAIGAVIFGVGLMVSDSLSGGASPIGDGLALLIAGLFAVATVITRRYAHVRMTPATCLGAILACAFAATQASTLATNASDAGFLFAFGILNLGFGMVCFALGARLIPAAYAALIGCFEPILGPVWVWLIHGEEPSQRALIGGAFVISALLGHIFLEFKRSASQRP
ncbi:MAG: DMT family transporter [Rhizobiaceae bacterium]|nr:DMT family transporter [Rhizobiaceae bacterium]